MSDQIRGLGRVHVTTTPDELPVDRAAAGWADGTTLAVAQGEERQPATATSAE